MRCLSHTRKFAPLKYGAALALCLCAYPFGAQTTSRGLATDLQGVSIPMRDGIRLTADVLLPSTSGRGLPCWSARLTAVILPTLVAFAFSCRAVTP